MIDAAGNWQDDVNQDDEREAQALKKQAANQKAPTLDASTQPAIPLAPTPGMGTSTPTPPTTGPAIPNAGATLDPMAFTPSQAVVTPAAPAAPVAAPSFGFAGGESDPSKALFGGDTAKINEYWAKQGVNVSGAGAVPYMAGTTPAQQDKGVQDYTAKLRAGTDTDVEKMLAASAAGTTGIDPAQKAQTDAFNAQTQAADTAADIAYKKANGAIFGPEDLGPGTTIGDPNSTDPVTSGKQFWESTGTPLQPNGQPIEGAPMLPPVTLPGNGPATDTGVSRIPLPTGPANDVGQGGQQPTDGGTLAGPYTGDPIQDAIAQASNNTSNNTTSNGASTLTPVTPDTALTNFRISAGPQTDRFKIAQDRYTAARDASEGGYQADLNRANEGAFGAGRGVSGMLRTSRGNIASDRQATLANQQSGFLNDALEGSIGDAYKNIGIDERQQSFEDSQQKTGFSQAMAIEELTNARTDAEFQQAMQKLLVGSEGDPARLELLLAQIFGGQSAQSADAAVRLAET